ncbi:hypothetical protein GO594_27680 [Pseudomonas otitidis]|uniref:Uncharacterized protein n=1 Tax=Metapseudomonas otitidis TaxID=319939 RepID=A0A7X3HDM5_9GAMM|nr:hypothetical protein [Pseudomonas otitidis]MWK59785.1 hypothetical protein [Pseudomonas otitidis]
MKYQVDLTYSKASRQPVYGICVEAASKSQAINEATRWAAKEGWKGTPVKVTARMVEECAA